MEDSEVIAITGTPGTGKTTLSEKLAEELDFELFDLNQFIKEEGIYEPDEDGTKIVDRDDLQNSFENILEEKNHNLVVDGLLSYLLSSNQVDHIVILRTNPNTLRKRLNRRDDFSEEKIEENIESEAIGAVTSESIERHGIENIFEINSTEKDPKEILETLKKGLENKVQLKPGNIDWLEEYVKHTNKD